MLTPDVTFVGALGTANGVDDAVAGLMGMAQMLSDIDIRCMMAEGDDVMTWFELHTTVAPPTPTVDWSHVRDGRIAIIPVTFDPRGILTGMAGMAGPAPD